MQQREAKRERKVETHSGTAQWDRKNKRFSMRTILEFLNSFNLEER